MRGLMQDRPLLISSLIVHADRHHGTTEIVSRLADGGLHRYTYREAHRRSRQLANALRRLGAGPGDRIATLAWNSFRHFEVYYAVSGVGAICHTINPILFVEQIVYIINHAEDRWIFFDPVVLPLVEQLRPRCPRVAGWIAFADRAGMPASFPEGLCFEELVAGESDELDWPVFDEETASSLCYTSGTTGNPKGVLYSHRATVLHSYGAALPDAMNLSARDVVLPVVPMFHANCWGLPYTCALVGATLVFPGPRLDGESLYELFEGEGVTFSGGVPTVWLGVLKYLAETGRHLSTLKRAVIGGSACAPAMIRALEEHNVEVLHAWGMTEMSPLGTVSQLKAKHRAATAEQRLAVKSRQGRAVYGVDLKIVDGEGRELPWDGNAFGDLLVRGPWIASGYFKGEGGDPLKGGWFPTGDVATIDPDGYIGITDRSKDVIKSGGEWISSIELENIAIAHPAVAEAAVIGVKHPKWDERPLLVVQKKAGAEVSRDELIAFYTGKVAKWWIPDDVVFVAGLPHTATGKLLKTKLRADYAGYRLPTA
jgi:acyl-CoA synthetase (AMP-forming)/AMP-acid ligase II